jgi:ferredoxin
MSVKIKFEPNGPSGLVPKGTSILAAARRLGFEIPACGECDGTCAVKIVNGAALLSGLTDIERKQLGSERVAAGERLACQCKATHAGELVIMLVAESERARTAQEKTRDLRREFSDLPFDRKLATLMQLETIAATEAFDKIAEVSVSWGKKIFDNVMPDDAAQKKQAAPEKEKPV